MPVIQEKPQKRSASFWNEDLWFVIGLSLALLLITSLPYIYATVTAPQDKQFMGVVIDAPDHLQYFSWMREFATANFSANKLTPEPNRPIFFNLLWWLLARLNNLVPIGFGGAVQVIRWVATPLFLWTCNLIAGWYFPDRLQRRIALLAMTLMSGLGWVLIVLKYTVTHGVTLFPLDIFIAEGNTFLDVLGYPHFIAAALYVFVFVLVMRGQQTGKLGYAVGAGLFALFLGWQHTYDLISVYFTLLAFAVMLFIRDRKLPVYMIKAGIIVGVISVWPAIYSVALTSLDPLWKEVLAQFDNADVFTPGPLHLPILFGIPLLLAIYTAVRERIWREKKISDFDLFLYGWFLVTFITIYLPVDYQVHLLNGWQVPMGILAVRGYFRWIHPGLVKTGRRILPSASIETLERIAAAGLIAIFAITNVYHLGQRFIDLHRYTYPYYLYRDEVQAMDWLSSQASGEDVILSSLNVGQYLPAYTGAHAFLAHWAQTVDYYTKEQMVDEFFAQETSSGQRETILNDFSVDYVFYGPAEKSLGAFDPANQPGLSLAYQSGSVEVFKVNR